MGRVPPEERISRQAEDKLAHRLAMVANERCRAELDAYNACSAGRSVSVVWACREAYRASNACIRRYVNDDNVAVMRRRWIAAGKPTRPDWAALMEGLVD